MAGKRTAEDAEPMTESAAQKALNKRLKLQRSERDDLDENGVKKDPEKG